MVQHLNGRAAALAEFGWTGRDAEWLALALPPQRRLPPLAVPRLPRERPRRAGRAVHRALPAVVRAPGRPPGARRAGVTALDAAVRGGPAVALPGAGSRARAPSAGRVRGGPAAPAAVARLRARPPRGAVAGDRDREGRRADRGGSAGGRAAAPRVSGKAGCPAALLRAQAAPRPRCRTGDVRLRPGRGRDGDRRPHVGRDARRAVGGTARRRARRRGRRRRPGPRALGGGRTGARRLDPCASGCRAPARRGGAGHARRAGRDPLGPGGGRPSRPGRLRRRQWRPGPDAHAGGRQGRGGAGRPAVTSGRTWRSTRVPE